MASTYVERKAQRQAEAAANAPRVLTNDELRAQREVIVRHQLDRDHPGHGCTEDQIRDYVAETHSDEAIAEHARHYRAQKLASEMAYAAQYAEDQQRQKAAAAVTRTRTARLTEANTRAMTYQERAEAAERKAQGLEAQLEGLWKGQGRR
jgi:hypothetical protein